MIVLSRVEHFLMIIVFYCNTSVGHCRCSLLLASRGSCSWFTCSFECPVRFRRYLFVILMISSSTSCILESLWRVLLLTYHGALNTNRSSVILVSVLKLLLFYFNLQRDSLLFSNEFVTQ
jgi:hypothetical protein